MPRRIINELLQGLNVRNLPFRANPVMPEHLGELIDLVEQGRVTGESRVSSRGL